MERKYYTTLTTANTTERVSSTSLHNTTKYFTKLSTARATQLTTVFGRKLALDAYVTHETSIDK